MKAQVIIYTHSNGECSPFNVHIFHIPQSNDPESEPSEQFDKLN